MARAKSSYRTSSNDGRSPSPPPSLIAEPPIIKDSASTVPPQQSTPALESFSEMTENVPLETANSDGSNDHCLNSKDWAADKVEVQELLSEMRTGASEKTKAVIFAWAKDAQVHRLAKLADEIIRHEEEFVFSEPSMLVLAELSQFLGIVRPFRSKKLNQIVQFHLQEKSDLGPREQVYRSLGESEKWTQVGLLLEPTSAAERVFWNNRLRNPEMTWNWEDPDARIALRTASDLLPTAPKPVQELFRAAVPESWWDLFASSRLNQNAASARKDLTAPSLAGSDESPPSRSRITIAALLALGGILGSGLTAAVFTVRSTMPLPLTQSVSLINETTQTEDAKPPAKTPSRPAQPAPDSNPILQHDRPPLSSWRLQEVSTIRSQYPALERLHHTVHTRGLQEAEPILKGGSSIASLRTPSYKALLRWAMVDPPQDPAVRRAVIRLFTLTPPLSDALPILERASLKGEPYHEEMREMAQIILSARPVPLLPEQIEQLQKIAD